MKRFFHLTSIPLVAAILAVALLLGGLTPAPASAQSPEQIDQLMRQIRERMLEIEQMLAHASREPTDLGAMLADLQDAIENGETDSLPPTLREFLESNPELLAELTAPAGATEEELREIEDRIRRQIYTEEDGLDQLLRDNPQILQGLFQEENTLEDLLQEFLAAEEDLQQLFQDTESTMMQTEEDIERLLEMAAQMQQQMQGQGQPQQQQQEQQGEQQQQDGQPENPQEGDPNQATDEYDPNPSSRPEGAPDPAEDPNAWTAQLPERDQEAARDAASGERPEGYEAELQEFYERLAQLARRMRQEREAGNDSGSDADGE